MDSTSELDTERCRPGDPGRQHRVAWACFLRWYEPDQVRRVCGWPHSQRVRAPRRRYSVAASLAPASRLHAPTVASRSQSTTSSMTAVPRARCGSRGGGPEGPAGDAGHGRQRLARAVGTRRSASPWYTSVGIDRRSSAARTRACSATPRRRSAIVVACSFSESARYASPTAGSRDRIAPSKSFSGRRSSARRVQHPGERPLPARDRRVERRRAQDQGVRQRPRRLCEDVAEGDQATERMTVERDRSTARCGPHGRETLLEIVVVPAPALDEGTTPARAAEAALVVAVTSSPAAASSADMLVSSRVLRDAVDEEDRPTARRRRPVADEDRRPIDARVVVTSEVGRRDAS